MFLASVHLQNIRCFRDAHLDFDLPGGNNRKWTVLLGENGAGTSTVLKATALALSGSDALAELVGEPRDWVTDGQEEGKIELEIETAKGRKRKICLTIRSDDDVASLVKRSKNKSSLKLINDALEHTTRNYPTFAYGPMRRLSTNYVDDQLREGLSHPRASSMRSLFHQDIGLHPFEQWTMQMDKDKNRIGLATVKEILTDFLETSFSHIDYERQSLIFDTPDGMVPLRGLSDGHQTIAAWVGDLLSQVTSIFGDYKQPLNARGLLMIDELDLHLHPKWQRRLLDFLNNRLPHMQLLVTTHSVVTAQQSPPGALHYCVRRDGPPVIESFDVDPRGMLLHQLIATEAFGGMSDESIAVETSKQEYRKLQRKEKKSAADRARMNSIEENLARRPDDEHADMVLTEEQRELMAQILGNAAENDD